MRDYAGDTLMTEVCLHHEALALDVGCRNIVDFQRNLAASARLIKAFFSHDFHLGESRDRLVRDAAHLESC